MIEQLHRQVIEVAKRAGVTHGRRFRIDTTVVETNVHYPTDSSLLRDTVRVITRTMQRASTALGDPRGRVRNRLRNVGRRVLIIGRQARSPETRDALVRSYRLCFAKIRSARFESRSVVSRSDTLQRHFDRGTVRRRRFPLMRNETAGCQSAAQPRRATVVAGVGQAARRS